MQITFAGCGDAMGSGGRFNTCFHVDGDAPPFLIDCGATSLVALKRAGIDHEAIRTIFVTHFHADHFMGLPFFVLDAQHLLKRKKPLTIVGPEGLSAQFGTAMRAAFQSSATADRGFEIRLEEIAPETPRKVNGVRVTATRVRHGKDANGPFLGYRFEQGGRTLAYTGDTEWTEALIGLGRDADLLICECSFLKPQGRFHLDAETLRQNLPRVGAKRVVLTHMGEEVLAKRDEIGFETAEDGMALTL